MKLFLSILALFCVQFSFSQQYSKVKIHASNAELQTLASMGVPVDHGMRKQGFFLISDFSEKEIDLIQQAGVAYEVLIPNVKKYYAEQSALGSNKNATCANLNGGFDPAVPDNFETSASSYAGFYKYQQMLDALDSMAAKYPSLITVKAPISNFLTWENRPIYHVIISDNPTVSDPSETKVLYTAIHHAREPLSMSQTIFYMWYLLENYATNEEVKFLVDNTEMYFVPCINPDGYIHNETTDPAGFGMHRKNKRPVGTSNPGVDLNRNYSYGWGTTGVSFNEDDDTYPGGPNDGNDYSFSEPETQAIQYLVETVGFTSAFNAHTHGKLLLYPIGTTNAEFADHHDYFDDLSSHMCSLNGYAAQKSSGLYPASGDSDDYMYKVDNGVGMKDTIFAMTPEIGSAFWPAASEVIPTCKEMVFPNLVLSHMTHKYLVVNETDPGSITSVNGYFHHDVMRLGLEAGSVSVSITPVQNIQTVGSAVAYNLGLRQTGTDSISYTLSAGLQFGDLIQYVLETDYGSWIYRDTITKTYGALPVQLVDDGSTTSNWTGNWNTTSTEFVSPSTSYTDSPGNYQNNADDTYEMVQSIDLTTATDAAVSFYAKWEIEADYDYCQFQVSIDNGSTWIGQCGNYTVEGYNTGGWGSGVQPDGEPIYEGTQSSWVLEEISLNDYLGQSIKVRFQLESDGGLRMDGFYFDDFTISYESDASVTEIEDMVKVFPNPANNEVRVSLMNPIAKGGYEIYNQMGQLVVSSTIEELTNEIRIATAEYSQGIYTLRIHDGGNYLNPVKLSVIH